VARGPLTFRQNDLVRALKGARAAGLDVARVEIDKAGKIVIVTEQGSTSLTEPSENPWDEVLNENPQALSIRP
jgi:hypothetical protein